MDVKLLFQAIIKFLLGLIFVFLFLFIPAGTLNYWNGWLFIGILFVPMFIVGIILMIINPKLLKKRLDINEKQSEQKWVLLFSGLIFIFGFISAGFDYKFKWMQLPKIVVIISVVLFLIEYILYAEVLRENAYLSRTIKIQENQKVIDTGLYGIVRHPMYSVTVLLFLTMPLVLGSFMSFLIFLFYPFIIAKRIKGEEEILERELDGYKQYKEKVKYKLIPFIW
ncbi:MAG: isoprenylcysteine carboxylmethyltransferase family protein [Clostridia bacterium]|nr:isoprenylcysteine carboxylmethyltransferase family protein [Clostridia bacterium]